MQEQLIAREDNRPNSLADILVSLSQNLHIFLQTSNNEQWVSEHLQLLLACGRIHYTKLRQHKKIVQKILTQVIAVEKYLCDNTLINQNVRNEIITRYKEAFHIADKLELTTDSEQLDLKLSEFKCRKYNPTKENQSVLVKHVPTQEDVLERLTKYHGYRLQAKQEGNVSKIAAREKDINAVEAEYIYRMLVYPQETALSWLLRCFKESSEDYKPLVKLTKKLLLKLVQYQKGDQSNTDILQLFSMLKTYAHRDLTVLNFLKEISDIVLGKDVAIKEQSDWQRYVQELATCRQQFQKELTKETVLSKQKRFSEQLKKFTGKIIQDCIDLLGPSPANLKLCFLGLGSMSIEMMAPFSDLEYVLLEKGADEPLDRCYTEALLNLFEFKIRSIGEYSLSSSPEQQRSAGFHLDKEGHPRANAEAALRLRGIPKDLISRCLPGITDHQSYSLYQADYLFGDQSLWQEYQTELQEFLSTRHKEIAKSDLAETWKKLQQSSSGFIDLKGEITAPLIYLLTDLKLYYLDQHEIKLNTPLLEILERLLTKDYGQELKSALSFGQYLRCRKQFLEKKQIKPESLTQEEKGWREALYIKEQVRLSYKHHQELLTQTAKPLIFDFLEKEFNYCFKDYQEEDSNKAAAFLEHLVKSLARKAAEISIYKKYYQELNLEDQERFLNHLKRYEPHERAKLIYHVIAGWPTESGHRCQVEDKKREWEAQLNQLVAKQETKAILILPAAKGEIKQGYLRQEIIGQIWDNQKKQLRPKASNSNHLVLAITVAGNHYHFKFYPEIPGFEIAVSSLHRLVIGHGTSLATLGRLIIKEGSLTKIYPVLISKTVAGDRCDIVLKKQQSIELDHKYYSQLALLTLLIQPEDGHPGNFIVVKTTASNGQGNSLTLTGIDNDHVFINPIKVGIKIGWFSKIDIISKSIIYCLKQAQEPLDSEAIKEFLHLNPRLVLEEWLNELEIYGESVEKIFAKKEGEQLANAKERSERSLVYMRLPIKLITQLYQRFVLLQKLLKRSEALTTMGLLPLVDKKLGEFYRKLHSDHGNAYQRFEEIKKRYYTKHPGRSDTNSTQLLSSAFGFQTKMLDLAKKGEYRPQEARKELQAIAGQYSGLVELIKEIEAGKLIILENLKIDFFRVRAISALDFGRLDKNLQKKILSILSKIEHIDKLRLKNVEVLTGGLWNLDIKKLLQNQSYLQILIIEGCKIEHLELPSLPRLTVLKVSSCSKLTSVSYTKGASLANLKRLEIIDCNGLVSISNNIFNQLQWLVLENNPLLDMPVLDTKELINNNKHRIKSCPKFAEYFNVEGEKYYNQRRYTLALENFNAAINNNSNQIEYYTNRAEVRSNLGKYKEGIEDYSEILRLTPRFVNNELEVKSRVLKGHSYSVEAITELRDGRLTSGSVDNTIRIWDLSSATCQKILKGHSYSVEAITELRDGSLASGSSDGTIRIWDLSSGACQKILKGHSGLVQAITELRDGSLASGSYDDTIRIWDLSSGECQKILKGHSDGIRALTELRDGRLASGSWDNTIRIWDLSSAACQKILKGHSGLVNTLIELKDGRLASGSDDTTIRIWDLSSAACQKILKGHSDSAYALTELKDGRLASGSYKEICIWDLSSAAYQKILKGHSDSVWALIELRDGRLASGSYDKTIRIWEGNNPKVADVYYKRAQLKFIFKHYKEAIIDYDAVILYKPKHVKAYCYRGIAYIKLEDITKAKADLEQVIKVAPKPIEAAEAYYQLAKIEGNSAYYQTAFNILQEYINNIERLEELTPQTKALFYKRLGVIYEKGRGTKKDIAKAMHYYQAAINTQEIMYKEKTAARLNALRLKLKTFGQDNPEITDEISCKIFQWLDKKSLYQAAQVNSRWQHLIQSGFFAKSQQQGIDSVATHQELRLT